MRNFTVFSVRFPLIFGGLLLLYSGLFAQQFQLNTISTKSSNSPLSPEQCGQKAIELIMEKEMGYFGTPDFFEDWMNQKIQERGAKPELFRTQNERRVIPVVVHIIHNGTPLGSGANIPDSQIFEQIRILNEDFRRLNADAVNTPLEFQPVAGDANIEFVLAKQDPNGLPTTGIVRLQGSKTVYSPDDGVLIGQLSQWNPQEYLNIWVLPLVQPYIGYASFPVSDLPGLNFSPVPAIMDGVTIDYRFFGKGGNASSASLGRTATHEVGHFFGLRHIWGDGGCGVDDFVSDTPLQDASNTSCTANLTRFSCGVSNMVQNYMDYTPDPCMNLFTKGQIERFDVVLANSPRRVTLVNNRATQAPILTDLDLAISRIIEPGEALCAQTIIPKVEVQNAGSTAISSARIEFRVNNQLIESKRFTLNLSTGQSSILSFKEFTAPLGSNSYTFQIIQVNDRSDDVINNNSQSSTPVFQNAVNLPYQFNFNSFPDGWIIVNPDKSFTWEKTSLTIDGQNQPAFFIRHYEYEGPGQLDYIISPQIDLSQYPNAQLVFEVAHGPYNQNGFQDELMIAVGQGCSDEFDLVNPPYVKSGARLETSSATLDEFIPTSSAQFRTELVNLNQFADLGAIRLAFITKNAFGNNIYIKNIRILPQEEFNYDLRVESLVTPNPISSGNHESEIIRIKNTGNLPVSRFLFLRTTNNSSTQTYLASGATIAPGESMNLSLNNSTSEGKNNLKFGISEPNFDQNGDNGEVFEQYNLESTETIEVPFRNRFDATPSISPWNTINPQSDQIAWVIKPKSGVTGDNLAVLESPQNGKSYWLGSPVFNLKSSSQASVFFDLSAGQVSASSTLKVLASANEGETYEEVWTKTGAALSSSSGEFVRNYIDLSSYAGSDSEGTVRLAFVFESNGNNDSPIYLDNIELFLRADPNPVIPDEGRTVVYPNPAREFVNIAFNLPTRENVTIRIISATGAVVQELNYPGTLNQTYTFSTSLFRSGLYVIQITGPTQSEIKRVFIN